MASGETPSDGPDITRLRSSGSCGGGDAPDRVPTVVYDELKRLGFAGARPARRWEDA
jgi:hypothetical protein